MLDERGVASDGDVVQRQPARLQGVARCYFAGAYARFGFHEDGMRAGEDAAARLLADQV